jgi:endo-alpha-1,4-polygalactosaminidase (GH114 family)
MKAKSNQNWKLYWNLGVFLLVLLENPQWVRFNGVYFTIFIAQVWKILIFEYILLLEIQ